MVGHAEALNTQAVELYMRLEEPNWAPWLRFGADQLAAQQRVFPEGQMLIGDGPLGPAAMLSANRINWDGRRESLPTWDGVAGASQTFAETCDPGGNTFCLMSMSVSPSERGNGVSRQVFSRIREYAAGQGIDHIIGDFRPSGFGRHKAETGQVDFAAYCSSTREDGLPQDPWLRAVKRQGGELLQVDNRAMVVEATCDEVDGWAAEYHPEKWQQVSDPAVVEQLVSQHQPGQDLEQVDQVLECGETGTWYLDRKNNKAVYIESNVWGEVPVEAPTETVSANPETPSKYRYDLPAEQVAELDRELVEQVKAANPDPDVYGVWVSSDHPFADALRAYELVHFPELPEIVTDDVEKRSLYYALVDTREDTDRVVHAARLSGVSMEEGAPGSHVNDEVPGFIVIEELIQKGQLTSDEFQAYCAENGIDTSKSFSVETNYRVGQRVPDRNGVRMADLCYLEFNRLLGASEGVDTGAVFATINRASRISFSHSGIDFSLIPVRQEADPDPQATKYDAVSLPYSPAMHRLAVSLGDLAVVKQMNFAKA